VRFFSPRSLCPPTKACGHTHSLGGDFVFDPRLNRAIAVLTAAIGPALRNVYRLPALADELESD